MEGEHTQTSIGAIPAQRFERSEHGKLKAFISYSRDDLDFADQLDIALRLLGFETSLDRHAISGAEEWRQRLATLIREADTIVFVLSPSSANSDICAWEVKEATRLRKRVIPVVFARLMAQRKQLEEMTAAQNERAKALRSTEQALTRTLRLQRRQAWAGSALIVVFAIIAWWGYGVINDQLAVTREAAREDIRGQIVAYAAAFGSQEMDVVDGLSTSPYMTPLAQKLRQKKNLMKAIVDAHQQVLAVSKGAQRPLLSTSMNGQIYLHQQPPTRRTRVLAVSVDDPGAGVSKLQGPPHDVDAMVAALTESGFSQSEVTILRNPKKAEIEDAITNIAQEFRPKSSVGAKGQLARMTSTLFIRVGLVPLKEPTAPDNTLLLFFFSGHGVQVAGENYIIPRLTLSSANLTEQSDIENSAVSLILDTHFPAVSFTPTR